MISGKAFKTWMELYSNLPIEHDEIIQTNETFNFFQGNTAGNNKVATVIDLLINLPFAGFFYGYANENNEAQIHVVHHLTKSSVPAIRFKDDGSQTLFGIQGTGVDTETVKIPSLFFHTLTKNMDGSTMALVFTPNLKAFMEYALHHG